MPPLILWIWPTAQHHSRVPRP